MTKNKDKKTPRPKEIGYEKLIKAIKNCDKEVQDKIIKQYKII